MLIIQYTNPLNLDSHVIETPLPEYKYKTLELLKIYANKTAPILCTMSGAYILHKNGQKEWIF